MFPRADKYRQKAEECRQEANKATDHDTKAGWLKLADKWQRMAQEAGGPAHNLRPKERRTIRIDGTPQLAVRAGAFHQHIPIRR